MKKFVLPLLILLVVHSSWAQRQNKQKGKNSAAGLPLSERIYFGGGGSFGSGTDSYGFRYTYIAANPLVGYRITLPFSAGLGINYQYINYPDQKFTRHQYGASPFVQYRFTRQFFAYAEYSMISVPSIDNSTRKIYDRLPIGLGYSLPIGRNAAINAMALYDVLYNKSTSVFYSPWVFRVFFSVGNFSF